MKLPKSIENILPDYLPIRFSVEQLSLLDIACDKAIEELTLKKTQAKMLNDTTVNLKEVDRRISLYHRSKRAIRESIDV